MRRIKEMLRLRSTARLSHRQLANALGIARSTVADYLARAEAAGLQWPLPDKLDEADVEALLFPDPPHSPADRQAPDFSCIHQELARKGMTIRLIWQEYKAANPDGYNYSRYCDLYRRWRKDLDVVMRQSHRNGERMFVDYAGMKVPIVDQVTGLIAEAEIFVAALGASSYTFVEATRSQGLADWIGSHQRALAYFGGVPQLVVPDNLKSGVTSPHRYDPDVNRTYAEMAEHYNVAILPARTRKPRDKAKAESAVQVVERTVLAPLRNHTFFSLAELNRAIEPLREQLNERPFQKLPGSRRSRFEQLDRPALGPLPAEAYELAEWKKARVNVDYHIDVFGHYYSVPYKHLRAQLDVRVTASSVECFKGGQRIAAHHRSHSKGAYSTLNEHMPDSHRQYAEWTPRRISSWGASIGPATAELLERVIAARAHPEQGYRACLGILRLTKLYGEPRLEQAAAYALEVGATSYKSLASILKHRRDEGARQLALPSVSEPINHENVRGAEYYRLTTTAAANPIEN